MICELTGLKLLFGKRVSKSNRRTNRVFKPNISSHRVFIDGIGFKRLKLSTRALRTIDKYDGLKNYLLKKKSSKESLKIKKLRNQILKE